MNQADPADSTATTVPSAGKCDELSSHAGGAVIPFHPHIEIVPNRKPSVTGALRVIQGDYCGSRSEFRRRYWDVNLARAEQELVEAKFHVATVDVRDVPNALAAWSARRAAAFDRVVAAVDKVAVTPAPSASALRMKKKAIGATWLRADGVRPALYRLAVACDAERLGVKA